MSVYSPHRDAILAFRALQEELRQAMLTQQRLKGHADSYIARGHPSVNSHQVSKFLRGESSVASTPLVTTFCNYAERPDLIEKILGFQKSLNDRCRSMAIMEEPALDLFLHFYDLEEEAAKRGDRGVFPAAFGKRHEKFVSQVLARQSGAFLKLNEAKVRDDLMRVYTSPNWQRHYNEARNAFIASYDAKAAVCEQLILKLRKYLPSEEVIAEHVSCTPTTVSRLKFPFEYFSKHHYAIVADATFEQFIKEGNALLKKLQDPAKAAKIVASTPSSNGLKRNIRKPPGKVVADEISDDVLPEVDEDPFLAQLDVWADASITDAVPFELTEANFRLLEHVPAAALRKALIANAQSFILLLNIGAMMNDAQSREILQEDVGEELEQVFSAMRKFSSNHPNGVLDVMNKQTQFWRNSRSTRTKTRPSKGRK